MVRGPVHLMMVWGQTIYAQAEPRLTSFLAPVISDHLERQIQCTHNIRN